jgi:hypothetical protein
MKFDWRINSENVGLSYKSKSYTYFNLCGNLIDLDLVDIWARCLLRKKRCFVLTLCLVRE